MRSSFFALCLAASSSCLFYCHAVPVQRCAGLFCLLVFMEADFVAQPCTRLLFFNLKAGFYYFCKGHELWKLSTVTIENCLKQHSIINLLQPYCKFQVHIIDWSQSNIQILYDLQVDNGIRQCVNSSWTGIFKNKFFVHGQYIIFATLLLNLVYRKW